MGRPLEVLAPGQVKGAVEVGRGPQVAFVAIVADTVVPSRVLPADGLGLVGGGVVANDDLEIGEGLGQQGIQGLAQILFAVIHRQTDTHPGRTIKHGISFSLSRRFSQEGPEVVNGGPQAGIEVHPGLPAQELPGLGNVGFAPHRIVLGQFPEHD